MNIKAFGNAPVRGQALRYGQGHGALNESERQLAMTIEPSKPAARLAADGWFESLRLPPCFSKGEDNEHE
jgi:hypothetical protein